MARRSNKGRRDQPTSTGRVVGVKADQSTWRRQLQQSRIKFDDDQKAIYLEALATNGRKGDAAKAAGVSRQTVLDHYENDPDFAEAYDEAWQIYTDRVAAEVLRRGTDGWLEPVYQKGERVLERVLNSDGTVKTDEDGRPLYMPASIRKFSDRLLELEAKRVDPTYRDKQTIDLNSNGGGVLVAPAGMTVEQAIEEGSKANEEARRRRTEEERAKSKTPPDEQ